MGFWLRFEMSTLKAENDEHLGPVSSKDIRKNYSFCGVLDVIRSDKLMCWCLEIHSQNCYLTEKYLFIKIFCKKRLFNKVKAKSRGLRKSSEAHYLCGKCESVKQLVCSGYCPVSQTQCLQTFVDCLTQSHCSWWGPSGLWKLKLLFLPVPGSGLGLRGEGAWNQHSPCCCVCIKNKQKIWVSRVIALIPFTDIEFT